ncbi:hypothetical protein [Oceanobacillus senegalensis]|uniref:hypothetical protein n=1 Tax=Oceanobacillus senegalensis TaxID=1936063 RepID=UPI000A310844|nr:hypothetical protein [Oceanobacillus senegalensis]
MSNKYNEKEALLLQALKTQYTILQLLENTLYETYLSEKELPEGEQNKELLLFSERARTIIAKKPKLKEIYNKLEEEYDISL